MACRETPNAARFVLVRQTPRFAGYRSKGNGQWGGYISGEDRCVDVKPPGEPMLAKLWDELPSGDYLRSAFHE